MVQKEDSGSLVVQGNCLHASAPHPLTTWSGWSAGPRSRTHFDWVRNFTAKGVNQESYQVKSASVFALFWNLIRSFGPPVVVQDLEQFASSSGIYGMDPAIYGGGKENLYAVTVDGVEVMFQNAHMSPPQGVFARNYARYVCFFPVVF